MPRTRPDPPPHAAPAPPADANAVRRLRRGLLRWYRRARRDLPWRADPPDPYHVLVSEAMLQQTQVATVVPYFQRFIAELPTLADLAAADEQRVLRLWQGLGYYRRARRLRAAARAIVEHHGGRVPDTAEALLTLPGVGRYTAGAIASIAFGRRAPILDGNAARVLARYFAVRDPIDQPAARRRLWALAEQAVPARRPGDFNQAVMELGARVCTPRSPDCVRCPVAAGCLARDLGVQDALPVVSKRARPTAVTHHVLAIDRGGRLCFEKRPDTGLWAGMWQLPTLEDPPPAPRSAASGAAAAPHLADWARGRLGLTVTQPRPAGGFTHQTTHRTISFALWACRRTAGALPQSVGRWRSPGAVDDLPLPNPQRRALALLARG